VALKLNGIQVPMFSVVEDAQAVKDNVLYALRALSVTDMDVGVERFNASGAVTYQLSISKAKVRPAAAPPARWEPWGPRAPCVCVWGVRGCRKTGPDFRRGGQDSSLLPAT
jgi:hypothetical protein